MWRAWGSAVGIIGDAGPVPARKNRVAASQRGLENADDVFERECH